MNCLIKITRLSYIKYDKIITSLPSKEFHWVGFGLFFEEFLGRVRI